jgi:hypothetical protein
MERLENGIYQYVLPRKDSMSFKFTPGSFTSIESDIDGETIPARILNPSALEMKTVSYTIHGWEDLSESRGDGFENTLLIASFMGMFCCLDCCLSGRPSGKQTIF